VGALSLCCVGYALTTLVDSNESAQPVIQAITLPIFFISGTFFPESIVPAWLLHVADIFPVRHLGHALLTAFSPSGGSGVDGMDLLVLAIWAIAGIAIATRRFSWMPRGGRDE
jgi:ABC-2 type transport system permease protein